MFRFFASTSSVPNPRTSHRGRRRPVRFEPLENRCLLAAGAPSFDITYDGADPPSGSQIALEMRGARFAEVVDLNGDGHDDLLYYDETDSSVYACTGTGTSLAAPQKLIETPELVEMTIGDVTGDGLPDLVAVHWKPSPGWLQIATYAGTAGGGFDSTARLTDYSVQFLKGKLLPQDSGEAVASNWRDLFLVETSRGTALGIAIDLTMQKYVGQGQYTSTDYFISFMIPPNDDPYTEDILFDVFGATGLNPALAGCVHTAADLDGDGVDDFIATENDQTLHVYTTLDRGASDYADHAYALPAGCTVEDVCLGDLDADGRLDVIVGLRDGLAGRLAIRLSGDPEAAPLRTLATVTIPQTLAAGAFDGSTGADIVLADDANALTTVVRHGSSFREQEPARDYKATTTADLDGDGYRDIVTASPGILTVRYGEAGHAFGEEQPLVSLTRTAADMLFADFTGDGRDDLILFDAATDRLLVYAQVDGGFVIAGQKTLHESVARLAVGNIDSDAWLDVVGITSLGGRYSVVFNDGGGALGLAAYRNIDAPVLATALEVANLDGYLGDEIVFYAPSTGEAAIALNDGDGTFSHTDTYDVGGVGSATGGDILSADLDGDGDLDLALCDGASDIHVMAASGGSFSNATAWSAGNAVSSLAAADVNADGRLDLIASADGAGTIRVLPASVDQPLAFEAARDYGQSSKITSPTCLRAVALDANASPDVLLAGGDTLGIFVNDAVGAVPTGAEVSLVIRGLDTALAAGAGESPLPYGREWIDEWSTFYVEVWAYAGGPGIDTFAVTLSESAGLFALDLASVEFGPAFDAGSVTPGAGSITLTGQTASGMPYTGATTFTLLARVKAQPASGGGLDMVPNGDHPQASDHGFTAAAHLTTPTSEAITPSEIDHTPTGVWGVPFDANDDGEVNRADYQLFQQCYGCIVGEAVDTFSGKYAGILDYDRNGVVDRADFRYFQQNFLATADAGTVIYPGTAHPVAPGGATAIQMALAPPASSPTSSDDGPIDSPTMTLAAIDYVFGEV